MVKHLLLGLVAMLAISDAGACEPTRTVDLRDQRALEELQRTNPEHFAKIEEIVSIILRSPARPDAELLRTKYNTTDVSIDRWVLRTSLPPKQLLRFTLDDVRYTTYVVRSDLAGGYAPAVSRP